MNQAEHKRAIRSFVRREGRMTRGQQRAFETLWPKYGIEADAPLGDLNQLFGRPGPKVLEIGFGMGDSLAEQAKAHPHNDYIGIEVHRPGVGHLLSIMEKQGLTNLRVFCADAVEVLKFRIPDGCLDAIQIFFPDPWPKKRHHKRRLIQIPLVELLVRKLKPGGKLHIATDWKNYAEHIIEVLQHIPALKNTAKEGDFLARPDSRPLTKFEQRGRQLGHGVWDVIYQRD
jgi:tRNA (guanine-N7-)-methyltransferase